MTNTNDAILIAGGYGVVGQQITACLRQRYPNLPLIIAGRNPAKGEALAASLGLASTAEINVEQRGPLHGVKPRAVLTVVNDPSDYLLQEALSLGLPLLDITRWTEKFKNAAAQISAQPCLAPVMLSSGWMAGLSSLLAVALSRRMRSVDSVDISVLFSLKDKAGPNSTEYMDRLATPFTVQVDGQPTQVMPFSDPRKVTFPDGSAHSVYRFDTPDQFTLPGNTGARSVAARIAFDDPFSTAMLRFLTRSGIWKWISGERFTSLRRSLLYNPGGGASHQVVVEVSGLAADGSPQHLRASLFDPLGQTHLTAVGTLIQLERLLGLDGAPPPAPGLCYPDSAPQIEPAFQTLRDFGVQINLTEHQPPTHA
jgi:hypothetical protein